MMAFLLIQVLHKMIDRLCEDRLSSHVPTSIDSTPAFDAMTTDQVLLLERLTASPQDRQLHIE